jgi:hypothetical protein
MPSRRQVEKDVASISNLKRQVKHLKRKTTVNRSTLKSVQAEKVGSNLLVLLKYLMGENKKTTMLLEQMSKSINKIEDELNGAEVEEEIAPQETIPKMQAAEPRRELPLSRIDADIIELIQRSPNNMVCADDVKSKLHYKGRNAACTRLNKLHKAGLLERYQLGHRVYYKFDAGKATKLLILSPPQ